MANRSRKEKDYFLLQETVLYFITVFGVLMSPFLPSLVAIIIYAEIPEIGSQANLWHPIRISAIMLVALLMTFFIERDKDHGKLTDEQRKKARQRNFKSRMVKHLAYGTMWTTIIDGVIKGVTNVH